MFIHSNHGAPVPNTESAHPLTDLAKAEPNAASEDFPKSENGKVGDNSGHKKFALMTNIIALSGARNWDEAKLEWEWVGWFKETNPYGTCLCGHSPITDHCVLMNRKNSERVIVGSICVKKFLGLPADKIFHAIERIQEDPARSLNAETINFAHKQGWISDWDRWFYLNTWRKKKLSWAQREKRIQINQKVLRRFQSDHGKLTRATLNRPA